MSSNTSVPIDTLVDQYLNYLLVEKGLSKKTLESYSRDLARYHEFMLENGVALISDSDTSSVLKHLIALRDSGLGARSIQALQPEALLGHRSKDAAEAV